MFKGQGGKTLPWPLWYDSAAARLSHYSEGNVLVVETNVKPFVLTNGKPIGRRGDPVLLRLDSGETIQHINVVGDSRASQATNDGIIYYQEVVGIHGARLAHPDSLVGLGIYGHKVVALRVFAWCRNGTLREIEHPIFHHGPRHLLKKAVFLGNGDVAGVIHFLHFARRVEKHNQVRLTATAREVFLRLAPGKGLLARHTAIDGHGVVAIGEHVVQRPLVMIDSRHAFGHIEVGVVPPQCGMPDDVAQFERRQGKRRVVVKGF